MSKPTQVNPLDAAVGAGKVSRAVALDLPRPAQAQIEAAREALGDVAGQIYLNGRISDAAISAALTAAAEVGDFCAECGATLPSHKQDCKSGLPEVDSLRAQCSFCGGMVEMSDSGIIAATIERCAQVADDMAAEIEAHSYQDTATRLAAEMLRKASAAIRALSDKPQPDPQRHLPRQRPDECVSRGRDMSKRKKRLWQIQCGEHQDIVLAYTIGRAWRKMTKGKTHGFSPLVRFIECYKNQPWKYITPKALDKLK